MSVTNSGAQHHSCFFYIAFCIPSMDLLDCFLMKQFLVWSDNFLALKVSKQNSLAKRSLYLLTVSLCEDWIDCELINLSIFTSYTPLLRIYFQILFLLTLFPGYDNALATNFSDLYFCSICLGGLICFLLQ